MTWRWLGLVLAAILVVAGCAAEEPPMFIGKTPFGGTWHVLSIDGEVIDERHRAPVLQVQVRGVLQAVTRCSELELRITLAPPSGISFGAPSEGGDDGPCDPMDRAIDDALRAALAGTQRFDGGRPGDRLTLTGTAGSVVLAQPAANPTF